MRRIKDTMEALGRIAKFAEAAKGARFVAGCVLFVLALLTGGPQPSCGDAGAASGTVIVIISRQADGLQDVLDMPWLIHGSEAAQSPVCATSAGGE